MQTARHQEDALGFSDDGNVKAAVHMVLGDLIEVMWCIAEDTVTLYLYVARFEEFFGIFLSGSI